MVRDHPNRSLAHYTRRHRNKYVRVDICLECLNLNMSCFGAVWVSSSTIYLIIWIKHAVFCHYQTIDMQTNGNIVFRVAHWCSMQLFNPGLSHRVEADDGQWRFRRHRILGLLLCKARMAWTEHRIHPVGSACFSRWAVWVVDPGNFGGRTGTCGFRRLSSKLDGCCSHMFFFVPSVGGFSNTNIFWAQPPEDWDVSWLCFSHATQDGNFSKLPSSIQRNCIICGYCQDSFHKQSHSTVPLPKICHHESSIQNINICQQDPTKINI